MASMTPEDSTQYLEYVSPAASGGELAQLAHLAELQAQAQARVADLEAQLNSAREELRDISERQVPELMDQIGIGEFTTTSGLKVKVDETIRASIPKAQAPRAFAWLKEHGHDAMIKRVVSVSFGKGEDDMAEALQNRLIQDHYEVEGGASVHPSTLSAFIREKLKAGEEVPLELFGVHRQRVSKITV